MEMEECLGAGRFSRSSARLQTQRITQDPCQVALSLSSYHGLQPVLQLFHPVELDQDLI